MTDGPLRPLTGQQERIADGIRRGRTYAEIAVEVGRTEDTVRYHVRQIANLFPNPDALDPYLVIFLWARHREWTREQGPLPRSA